MAYVYAACAVRVTIFSTDSKMQPVFNFTEVHTLTLATRSHAFLTTQPNVQLMVLHWASSCKLYSYYPTYCNHVHIPNTSIV